MAPLQQIRKITAYLIAATILFSACSKDETAPPEPEEEPAPTVTTGIYRVNNLAADTTANSGSTAKPVYYSLETNQIIPDTKVQTDNWDIAFTGIYNSSILINNGKGTTSPGYGGPGKGAAYLQVYSDIEAEYYDAPGNPIKSAPTRAMMDEAFDKVKAAPEDDKMKTNILIGLDYFSGSTVGWAYYDFYGQVFPDKPNDEVSHVCYTLPRPIIIKTAKGNYAKLVIYSMYKDAPEVPSRANKPGFLSFKYAIQKDGSKNLDIQ